MYRQSLMAAGGFAPIITSRAIPPEIPGGEGQNQDSEQIEPVLNSGGCAAQCEDESAAEIERDQQCIHYDLFVDHQLAYGESHA